MLEVSVSTGKGMNRHTALVQVYGYETLTPRAARAALEIAGFNTGEAWTVDDNSSEYSFMGVYGYRVYAKSARKLYPEMY